MKNTTLIAGSKETISTLSDQIYKFIPRKMINLKTYALDQVTTLNLKNENLIIFSSLLVYNEVKGLTSIPKSCKTIIGNRTLNFNYIEKIISIEKQPTSYNMRFKVPLLRRCTQIHSVRAVALNLMNFLNPRNVI